MIHAVQNKKDWCKTGPQIKISVRSMEKALCQDKITKLYTTGHAPKIKVRFSFMRKQRNGSSLEQRLAIASNRNLGHLSAISVAKGIVLGTSCEADLVPASLAVIRRSYASLASNELFRVVLRAQLCANAVNNCLITVWLRISNVSAYISAPRNGTYPRVYVVACASPRIAILRIGRPQVVHSTTHRERENCVGAFSRQLHTDPPSR